MVCKLCCVSDTLACTLNGVERKCVFPFKHHGVTYNQCTKNHADRPWCSTKKDANDNHLPGAFGYCGPCQGVLHFLGIIIHKRAESIKLFFHILPDLWKYLSASHCVLATYHVQSQENLVNLLKLGYETFQKKRLALVLKIGTNTSLGIARDLNNLPFPNLPFLVAAVLSNGEEQFLCPVVGELNPRLQDVMCDLSYTTYKNRILRAGVLGIPPYFTMKDTKIDGVDVKLLKLLAEKMRFQPNIIIPKKFLAVAHVVGVCN